MTLEIGTAWFFFSVVKNKHSASVTLVVTSVREQTAVVSRINQLELQNVHDKFRPIFVVWFPQTNPP